MLPKHTGSIPDQGTKTLHVVTYEQKEKKQKEQKEKKITVAAANNMVLASNTFYF